MSELSRKYVKSAVGDIGTGAGFPGVVFAIRYPDVPVVLYEKMQKRRTYLEDLLKSLSLTNLSLREGFEKREKADFYFARAVLPPAELFPWLGQRLKNGDRFCLNHGSVRKETSVPAFFSMMGRERYELPSEQGFREIEIYEKVPRGT